MNIDSKRLNLIINQTINASMSVLKASLPEFSEAALRELKLDMGGYMSDTIEAHIAGLTEDEYKKQPNVRPF